MHYECNFLHIDDRHLWANHIAIFGVVRTRIQTYLYVNMSVKSRIVMVKFRLDGKTAMCMKYYKLKLIVWSMILGSDVHKRYM
jgi:hypothetical protein